MMYYMTYYNILIYRVYSCHVYIVYTWGNVWAYEWKTNPATKMYRNKELPLLSVMEVLHTPRQGKGEAKVVACSG